MAPQVINPSLPLSSESEQMEAGVLKLPFFLFSHCVGHLSILHDSKKEESDKLWLIFNIKQKQIFNINIKQKQKHLAKARWIINTWILFYLETYCEPYLHSPH